jgi:hypothetical protein
MSINLDGVFLGTKHSLAAMRLSVPVNGLIINISSIMGLIGAPDIAAYNASKGGVRLYSQSVALSCAEKRLAIRVNTIHPGFVDTPLLARKAGLVFLISGLREIGANTGLVPGLDFRKRCLQMSGDGVHPECTQHQVAGWVWVVGYRNHRLCRTHRIARLLAAALGGAVETRPRCFGVIRDSAGGLTQ